MNWFATPNINMVVYVARTSCIIRQVMRAFLLLLSPISIFGISKTFNNFSYKIPLSTGKCSCGLNLTTDNQLDFIRIGWQIFWTTANCLSILLQNMFYSQKGINRSTGKKNCWAKKIKRSLYRPRQAPRFPGGSGSQIFKQSARKDDKVRQPYSPATFTPKEIFLVLISIRDWVESRAIVRL